MCMYTCSEHHITYLYFIRTLMHFAYLMFISQWLWYRQDAVRRYCNFRATVPSTASQYNVAVLMTKCSHRNSQSVMLKLNQLAVQTTLNYNITNGLHSRDVTSSSDGAVLLATVGLSVYGTNSLSNCRRCIIWILLM